MQRIPETILMAIVHFPNIFTKITNQNTYHSSATTVIALIHMLIADFPELKPYLLSSSDSLTPFINIYINQQDIRALDKENTPLQAADKVRLIPAMGGG